MSIAMIIQVTVLSIMAVVVILSGIIGLIKVVPEINAICRGEQKNSRDGNHD